MQSQTEQNQAPATEQESNQQIVGYFLAWEEFNHEFKEMFYVKDENKDVRDKRDRTLYRSCAKLLSLDEVFEFIKKRTEEYKSVPAPKRKENGFIDTEQIFPTKQFIPENWIIIPFFSIAQFESWQEGDEDE